MGVLRLSVLVSPAGQRTRHGGESTRGWIARATRKCTKNDKEHERHKPSNVHKKRPNQSTPNSAEPLSEASTERLLR